MILKYEPELDWLIANSGVFQEDDFTGTIRLLTIDRIEFNSVEMTSGEGEYIPANQVQNKRMKMDCESGSGSNGGGGSSGEGGPESGGDTGSTGNDGGTGTSDGSGNTSGDGGGSTDYTTGTAGSCTWLMSDGLTIVDCGDNSTPDIEIPVYEPPAPSVTKTVVTCETVEALTIGDGDTIGNLPPASLFDDYSGDGVNDPDYEAESYQGPLKEIPTKFELDNGKSVDVTFGVTQSDIKSAQNPVKPSLVDAIEFALNEVSKLHDINHIHVSSTTNGEHHPQSSHYRNKAVDISRINNEKIYNIRNSEIVKDFQEAFERFYDIRENFGTHLKNKLGEPYEVGGHQDHIHISVN